MEQEVISVDKVPKPINMIKLPAHVGAFRVWRKGGDYWCPILDADGNELCRVIKTESEVPSETHGRAALIVELLNKHENRT